MELLSYGRDSAAGICIPMGKHNKLLRWFDRYEIPAMMGQNNIYDAGEIQIRSQRSAKMYDDWTFVAVINVNTRMEALTQANRESPCSAKFYKEFYFNKNAIFLLQPYDSGIHR